MGIHAFVPLVKVKTMRTIKWLLVALTVSIYFSGFMIYSEVLKHNRMADITVTPGDGVKCSSVDNDIHCYRINMFTEGYIGDPDLDE